MPIRSFDIPDELDAFIAGSVESGRYPNANAVIAAALDRLNEDEGEYNDRMFELRKAIQDGFDSGEAKGSTGEVFARVRERAGVRVRTSV